MDDYNKEILPPMEYVKFEEIIKKYREKFDQFKNQYGEIIYEKMMDDYNKRNFPESDDECDYYENLDDELYEYEDILEESRQHPLVAHDDILEEIKSHPQVKYDKYYNTQQQCDIWLPRSKIFNEQGEKRI
ncbi:hypothetical protein CHS0354_030306, partial [Potamilus streckersoni]